MFLGCGSRMEVPKEPTKKAKPRSPTTEGPPLTTSGLDKESAPEGNASHGSTRKNRDNIMWEVLHIVRKRLEDEENVHAKAVKVQNERMDGFETTLTSHGVLLNKILKRMGEASGLVGKKGSTRGATRRGRPRGRATVSVRASATAKSAAEDGKQGLARKLTFEDYDESEEERAWSPGMGNPETYYNHISVWYDGASLPKAIDLVFPLPDGMYFEGMELAVTSYIFGQGLEMGEILCAHECCLGDRRALRTLCPNEEVMDDVLCLVAAMAKKQHERDIYKRWWLPPSFAEIALNPTGYDPNMLSLIKNRFMGLADKLRQVYVPMLRGKHWYLLIVDMYQTSLIYLDSLKNPEDVAERKKQMKYVAFFLETMLAEEGFYEQYDGHTPRCSGYAWAEPTTGQQPEESKDCGVWVAQWMMQANLWGDHDLPVVNDNTRMRLAVDLVMGRHNPIRNDVCQSAVHDWDKKVKAGARKKSKKALETNPADPEPVPAPSGSVEF